MSRFTTDVGPFAIVPLWLLASNLSDRAVRLYAVLAARYADREGRSFPSRSRLAVDMGVSVDSVDRALAELVARGAVGVTRRHGPKGDRTSNEYVVRAVDPAPGETEALLAAVGGSVDDGGSRTGAAGEVAAPVRPGSRTAAAGGSRTGAATRTSTSLEPDPRNQSLRRIHQRFAEFQAAWPKGFWTGHEAALRVWEALAPDDALASEIMASLEAHKASHPRWRPDPRTGEVFIPNPRTWLNQKRWKDDVVRPRMERPVPAPAPARKVDPIDPALVDRVLADPELSALVENEIELSLAAYRGRMTPEALASARASARRGVAERFVHRLKPEGVRA